MSDTTSTTLPTITLDQQDLDYAPGETIGITVSNVTEGGEVILWVAHVTAGDDGVLGTWDDVLAYDLSGTTSPWIVTDGGAGDLDGLVNGVIQTTWYVDQDAAYQTFQLSATDGTSGGTQTVNFTDTPPSSTPVPADDTNGTGGLLISAEEVVDSTGTGKIFSFLQVQATGTEEAFNAYDPPVLDSGSTANYNRPIAFSEIPVVTIEGQTYLEFWVDLNENNNGTNPQISLDELKLYSSSSGTIATLESLLNSADEFYNLDAGQDTSILLNDWNTGSGEGDYIIRVPITAEQLASLQAENPYIYLYSKFGGEENYDSSGGFEEWYVQKQAFVPFDISGTKYTDVDGDGNIEAGDTGLGGVTIFIDMNEDGNFDDGVDLSTTTAADGTWSFTDLGVGYAGKMIYEVLPDGYVQTRGVAGYEITGTSGADQTNLDFANFELFDISGYKWTDSDGDAKWDASEDGLQGWTIYLDSDTDFSNGVLATTTTDLTGKYVFANLGPGTYYVYEDTSDSDWTNTYNGATSVTGQSGVNVGGDTGVAEALNFGNFEEVSVSGYKWTDTDGDAKWDASEDGLQGWTIYLDNDTNFSNGVLATTTTDSNGKYVFANLGPGTYYVYESTSDSDWTNTYNGATSFTAQSGVNVGGDTGVAEAFNFGNFEEISVSGYKWTDTDGDAQWDGTEDGLAGWTIYLDTDNNVGNGYVASTTTGAGGYYEFSNVGPGTYYVYEDTSDSDWTNTYNGATSFTAQSGVNVGGDTGVAEAFNFGNFEEVSVSGYKWTDADGDAQWDGTETGLAGWTIYLDTDNNVGNGYVASTTTGAGGYYEFSNVGPGTYYVYEGMQNNWLQTYNGSTSFTVQSGVDVGGDSGEAEAFNFGNHYYVPGNDARTIGFWSQRTYLWDGEKDTRADNLVKSGVIEGNEYNKAQIKAGFNDDIIWALFGTKPTYLMVGDRDGDGYADPGENILYVDMDVARSIINSSSTTGSDPRTLMLKQAIGAQLNIYNGVNNPGEPWSSPDSSYQKAAGDMITEAVLWLKSFGDGLISDGYITKNTGTTTSNGDYNISGKKGVGFVDTLSFSNITDKFDAADRAEFWSTQVDVDGTGANVWATGEGLKNVLDAFNNNKIVSDGSFVGWNMSGSPETSVIIDPSNFTLDSADAFWSVAKEAGVGGLFYV